MIAGAQGPRRGLLELEGVPLESKSPRDAQQRGIGYVPQDRRSEGVIQEMLLRENITLPVLPTFFSKGILNKHKERALAGDLIKRLNVQPPNPERVMNKLSGGNQQKAVFARNFGLSLRVLVLDEPSQGIDVGARREVADVIQRLAADGIGVVLASSDYAEIAQVCDRVLILDRGVLVTELAGRGLTEDKLTATCLGASNKGPVPVETSPDV
jgi:ribose transport system ATP-binding protein